MQIYHIIIGLTVILGIFIAGLLTGMRFRPRRLSPADFRALGEQYEINMRSLIDENKALVQRWDSIGKTLAAFGSIGDREKLSLLIARYLKEEMQAQHIAVLFKEETFFKVLATEGLDAASKTFLEFPKDSPLVKYVSNFPDVVTITSKEREFQHFRQMKEKMSEILMMPIKIGDELLGILWIARNRKGTAFTTGQKVILKHLSSSLGYLIKNLQLINQLKDRALKIVTGLAKALEQKDEYTKGHSERVTAYSVMFAKHIGVAPHTVEIIERAALLHDIGKIGIPERILNKPERLTPEEYEIVKFHPLYGAELLKILGFLKDELILILHHHEKFDGTGYPYGLKHNNIPLGAVVISLADVFDALVSNRPYRRGNSIEKAIIIMESMKGQNFAPDILDRFLSFVKTHIKDDEFSEGGVRMVSAEEPQIEDLTEKFNK